MAKTRRQLAEELLRRRSVASGSLDDIGGDLSIADIISNIIEPRPEPKTVVTPEAISVAQKLLAGQSKERLQSRETPLEDMLAGKTVFDPVEQARTTSELDPSELMSRPEFTEGEALLERMLRGEDITDDEVKRMSDIDLVLQSRQAPIPSAQDIADEVAAATGIPSDRPTPLAPRSEFVTRPGEELTTDEFEGETDTVKAKPKTRKQIIKAALKRRQGTPSRRPSEVGDLLARTLRKDRAPEARALDVSRAMIESARGKKLGISKAETSPMFKGSTFNPTAAVRTIGQLNNQMFKTQNFERLATLKAKQARILENLKFMNDARLAIIKDKLKGAGSSISQKDKLARAGAIYNTLTSIHKIDGDNYKQSIDTIANSPIARQSEDAQNIIKNFNESGDILKRFYKGTLTDLTKEAGIVLPQYDSAKQTREEFQKLEQLKAEAKDFEAAQVPLGQQISEADAELNRLNEQIKAKGF